MCKSSLLVSAVGSLIVLARFAEAGGTTDQERIEGTWVVYKSEHAGRTLPETTKPLKWVFKKEAITNLDEKGEVIKAVFKLDSTKSPKEIDIQITFAKSDAKQTYEEAKAKGKWVKGIYTFEGKTLKLALGKLGGQRLAQFSSVGQGNRVLYLKRSK
jgi:uncharacterized protein (TIGR03067 family)